MDQTLHRMALKWDLSDLRPLSLSAASKVYAAHSPRLGSVVVKTAIDRDRLRSEYNTLQGLSGGCVCRVYDYDRDSGWLLEERILPGTPLRAESSLEKRIQVLAQIFPRIHKSCTDGISYLDLLSSAYFFCKRSGASSLLHDKAELARSICAEMFDKYPERVLLHGDLHHDNLLLHSDGHYVVIDPKGVIGPSILDLPRFILNELDAPHSGSDAVHIDTVISMISDRFDYPAEDIRKVYYMESVLANVWHLEDGEVINSHQLKLAEDIFQQLPLPRVTNTINKTEDFPMSNFVLYTDSGCDISPELLAEWGVSWSSLTFRFEDEEVEYTSTDMSFKEFYDRMRAGGSAKTAAINIGTFLDAFEPLLQQGKDILYLGFSSGLSTTYNSAVIAAQQLSAQYPDRKIITVDTLCASAGQGLLVYHAKEKQLSGATIEETAAYIEEIKLNLCHWFTVDDLVYLKRGGRVSPTVAFVGNLLGIKPVLHVDNEGKLINMSKARGRKNALTALADKYTELALDPSDGTIFISNGDCEEDAKYVAQLIQERHGVSVQLITYVGSVIGAHSGPGTVALFFLGKER